MSREILKFSVHPRKKLLGYDQWFKIIKKGSWTTGWRTCGKNRSGGSTNGDSTTIFSVADLYELVKRYDKDFSAGRPVNPALVNADGTPMVVYHGTNSEAFYVFDSSQSSKRVRLNTLGDGYYLTGSQDTAERFCSWSEWILRWCGCGNQKWWRSLFVWPR